MKNIEEILFIIQARNNSERVPNKMLRPFSGTNLFEIALEKIKKTKIPPENFRASVYEDSLSEITKKHGFIPYRRSLKSNKEERDIRSMYEWYNKFPQFKYAIKINACHLFLKPETIDSFIDHYIDSKNDGLFSVIKNKQYYWNEDKELISKWPDGYNIMNTKYVGPTYEAAHCLYAGKLDLIGEGKWMGEPPYTKNNPELFEVDSFESLDIDHEWQFELYTSYWSKLIG